MSRRRTVLVAHPSPELYGSDRVLLESVSGLVEAGWDVVVTVPETGPLVPELEARGARVELCPALVLRKALLRPSGLWQLLRLTVGSLRHGRRLLRRLRPDAVYVNTVTIPLWLVSARLRRIPTLCHVHEAERSAHRAVRLVLALPVLLAGVVVANSRFSIDVLTGSVPRLAGRTRLVLNGVPGPPQVHPPRETLDPPVRLVYVGRLSPRKGVDVAVEALADLVADGTDAHLDLVGAVFAGYEWFEDQLQETARRRGVTDRVHLHGFVDPVWDLVAAGDVVLVPSTVDEPFGNTAVEAVLAARPVVAGATSGLLEATAGYRSARTVRPGDPRALADAVREVVADWPAQREAAVQDAREAEARHAPRTYRATVAGVVDELVGG
jgi:glycosyltransferase involved in cell wall biosynthesis